MGAPRPSVKKSTWPTSFLFCIQLSRDLPARNPQAIPNASNTFMAIRKKKNPSDGKYTMMYNADINESFLAFLGSFTCSISTCRPDVVSRMIPPSDISSLLVKCSRKISPRRGFIGPRCGSVSSHRGFISSHRGLSLVSCRIDYT